jgi:hypothetical protein
MEFLSFLQGSELCSNSDALRKELHAQLKRRLIENERVGHMEDLLICTLLDPRYAPTI